MSDIDEFMEMIQEKKGLLKILAISVTLIVFTFLVTQNIRLNNERDGEGVDIYEELIEEDFLGDELETIDEEKQLEIEQPPSEIVVDVKGAVFEPGVYKMEPNNRIVDAIEKAGGFLDQAERNVVNLAQILEDQMVIYVPKIGEEGFEPSAIIQASSTGGNTDEIDSGKVDINTADKSSLMTLNGIGNSKADNILSYRDEHGLFQSIEEIKNVSGIGEATFNNLKEFITISP